MSRFPSLDILHSACLSLPKPDPDRVAAIRRRDAILTKPAGSLGRLELLAEWFGSWRAPKLERPVICIFAGNHGVLAQGISAWPADVTAAMVGNFQTGGAAINQLARSANAELMIHPLAELRPSADLTLEPALSEQEFLGAVSCGYDAVPTSCDLLALGEMGVGNTTAASALTAALFDGNGATWAGQGAGLDTAGIRRKAEAIDRAIALHSRNHDVLELARRYGGWELAALLGACLAARHHRIPVLLDGFVVTAAVAPLARLHSEGLAHTQLAHCSHEQGHRNLAALLSLDPLLDLQLRLGEGSGAALAIPLVRAALACHTGMACFDDVAIGNRNERTLVN